MNLIFTHGARRSYLPAMKFYHSPVIFRYLFLATLVCLPLFVAFGQTDCSALGSATATATPADCPSNGTIQVATSAGASNPGYLYQIISGPSGGGYPTNTVTSSLFESLPAGAYTIRITCGTTTQDVSAVVDDHYTPLSLSVTAGAITCSSGSASTTITATGNGGKGTLQYAILKSESANAPDVNFTYGTASSFPVTGLGTYQVRVKDECNNYITYSATVTSTAPVATLRFIYANTSVCGTTSLKFDMFPAAGGGVIDPTNSGYRVQFYDISGTTGCPESSDGLTLLSDKEVLSDADLNLEGSPLTATRVLIKTISPCGEENLTCLDLPNTSMEFYPKVNVPCSPYITHVDIAVDAWNFTYPANIVVRADDASGAILLDAPINTFADRATVAQNLPVHSAYWVELTDACGQSAVSTVVLPSPGSGAQFGGNTDLHCVSEPGHYRYYAYMFGYIPGIGSSALIQLVDLNGNVVATADSYEPSNNSVFFNDVPAGTYKIRVTSDNGDCITEVDGQVEITDSPSTTFRFNVSAEKYPLCGGNADIRAILDYNGTAQISFSITDSNNQTISNSNGLFANMAPGTYTLTATANMNNCGKPEETRSVSVTVTEEDSYPQVVKMLGVICETGYGPATTGKAIFQFSGFAPFTVEVTKKVVPAATVPDAIYADVPETWTLDDLEPDATYLIRIIDQCGKTAVTEVTIKPLEMITLSNADEPCFEESYTFGVEDLLNATYSWTHNGTPLGVTSREITIDSYDASSHDGTYICTVSLADGCIIREVEIDLTGEDCKLPVKLVSFKGQREGQVAVLNWSTTAEINSDRFEVERSHDGTRWDKAGSVKAGGDVAVLSHYTWTDSYPQPGNNYYRLKTIDRDATYEYSRMISVGMPGTAGASMVAVYPNPAVSELYLLHKGVDVSYEIFDQNGNGKLKGVYSEKGIHVGGLQPGVYTIRFSRPGEPVQVRRLVVGK